jgi:hypothetical protein
MCIQARTIVDFPLHETVSTMSSRPYRKIVPTAKLTAENAGDLVLTLHHRAVASASLAAPPPQNTPAPVSEPSGVPTDFDVNSSPDLAPTRILTKRPHTQPIPSDPILIDNDADATDAEDAPKAKKPKTTPGQGLQTDVSVIEIDDVDDPQSEQLNKTEPTADIKEFFTTLPRAPGQDKRRVQCKLCE